MTVFIVIVYASSMITPKNQIHILLFYFSLFHFAAAMAFALAMVMSKSMCAFECRYTEKWYLFI